MCSYSPRTVRLPRDADLSKIEAKYENGVLQLKIPKVMRTQPSHADNRGLLCLRTMACTLSVPQCEDSSA